MRSAQRLHLGLRRASLSSAWTWRLMFDSATWSRSIRVSAATPLRASASAAHEPTPPMPDDGHARGADARVRGIAVQAAQAAEAALEVGCVAATGVGDVHGHASRRRFDRQTW